MLELWDKKLAVKTELWNNYITTDSKIYFLRWYVFKNKLKLNLTAITSAYYWYSWKILNIIFKCSLANDATKLCVHAQFRNIRYIVASYHGIAMKSHALILKTINILAKKKKKDANYYYLSLKYIIARVLVSKTVGLFYIKGKHILSFLQSYKYWSELPFKKYCLYILYLNLNLNKYFYKRKQSVKRRLARRLLKMERFKC